MTCLLSAVSRGASTACIFPSSSWVSSASCRGRCDGGASRGLGRGPSFPPGSPLSPPFLLCGERRLRSRRPVLRWREKRPPGEGQPGPPWGRVGGPVSRARRPTPTGPACTPPRLPFRVLGPPAGAVLLTAPRSPHRRVWPPPFGSQQRCRGGDMQVCGRLGLV